MKRNRIAFFLLILFCAVLLLPRPARAARILTLDRAVWINDYQIVLEFSEPIAVNKERQNNGPYAAIRLVTGAKNQVAKTDDGKYLQWKGSLEYADATHDKLLWTLADNRLGVTDVGDILSYRGQLAPYSRYAARFCLEEIPYDSSVPAATGLLDNVTTADGEVHLSANRPVGYDGAYCPIEKDYAYPLDPAQTESLISRRVEASFSLGQGKEEETPAVTEQPASPLVSALIVGSGCLLAAALVGIGLAARKKERKNRHEN